MAISDEQMNTFRTGMALLTAWAQTLSDQPQTAETTAEIVRELIGRGADGIMEGIVGLQSVAGALLVREAQRDEVSLQDALQRLALYGEALGDT